MTAFSFFFSGVLVEASRRHPSPVDVRPEHVQQRRQVPDLPRAAQRLEAADPVPAAVGPGALRVPRRVQPANQEEDQAQRSG